MWSASIAATGPKTLRRHISTQHGLSPDEYLKRWVLRSNHPLIAPGYSEHRSTVGKESGFGRKPKAQVTPAALPGEAATPVDNDSQTPPLRRRGSRSRTFPETTIGRSTMIGFSTIAAMSSSSEFDGSIPAATASFLRSNLPRRHV
jgi:hypothetical protein